MRSASLQDSTPGAFDVEAYLASTGPASAVVQYRPRAVAFSQGDPATDVSYIQDGVVMLSVTSRLGREAVVAMLGPGDFFGEGVLAGQSVRIGTAVAVVATSVLNIHREAMVRLLREESAFSDRFLSHVLSRNIRIESDLADQLLNPGEKRLARTLLLLSECGRASPDRVLSKISQQMLADMIGCTRPRVNHFMNKFRRLGLIEYSSGIKVNRALLSVVLDG